MKRSAAHVSLILIMPADVVVQPIEELARRFAQVVEDASRRAIGERGSFSIAIPGGSAAERLLPALIPAPLDWQKWDVYWVDERMVPSADPDCNARAARAAWLDHVAVPAERVHPMPGDAPQGAAAAAEYARLLRERLGRPARIDFVLLGMGEDGHVASLFPGHPLLRAWDRDVAVLDDAPKAPPRRMTLTLRALTNARRIVLVATGAAKAEAIADVLENEDSELPAALAIMGEAPVTFLLDPEAASKILR
jgi:6-phosphogluconolactonase